MRKKGIFSVALIAFLVVSVLTGCNLGVGSAGDSEDSRVVSAELPGGQTGPSPAVSGSSGISAAVMAPLHVDNWSEFQTHLNTAAQMGVQAVSVDVWWGDVEGSSDGSFNWSYYDTVFGYITAAGLDVVPIMSFHQAGGNVGDDYTSYLPSWIWSSTALSATDMQYQSETGAYNAEFVSLWADDYVIQQYIDFMNAFEDHYSYLASDIDELNISNGPAGELRYPSYNGHDWGGYPNRGTLQAYGTLARQDFRDDMIAEYGSLAGINTAWGTSLGSITEVNPPSDTDTFFNNGDYVNTQYGRDFIDWYNQSLREHGERMIAAAKTAFDDDFAAIDLGMKIPGIHWYIADASHPRLAEMTAGLIQSSVDYGSSSTGHGYHNIISTFAGKGRTVNLHFTALEMGNDPSSGGSMAEDLVFWVAEAADQVGVPIKGENALSGGVETNFGWDQIENAFDWASYAGLTVLRMANVVSGGIGQSRYTTFIAERVGSSDQHWSEAYFRGTPNSWGTTPMTFNSATELWETTQYFSGSDPRFKISHYQDWQEAYPASDYQITEGDGTYDITFDDITKAITVTKQSGSGGDDLTIHYREWESATTYMVHPWDGLSGDITMSYEGYINGGHWWVVTIPDAPSSFKFCFTNSNGNWDGVNRQYAEQADEIYSVYNDSTVYTSRP